MKFSTRTEFLVLVILVSLCGGFRAAAQSPTGQILGVVLDSSGLPMPGVPIVVAGELTGLLYQAKTNEMGNYLVRGLPSGRFTISAEKEGFKKAVHQGVSVTALQDVRVDFALEVGAVAQSVVVTGEVAEVDTRTSTVGTLVDGQRIVDLPLNGRNVISFSSLVPGVSRTSVANTVSSGQQAINVNGNRSYSTNMQLDGGSMYYPMRGQGLNMPPPDAVQEIKFITSGVTAEYGRGTAVFSVVTKSGTNELHGTLWEYLRNDKMDARSFFDKSKAKLRYNQFGATAGGPILKNKFFFFASYQGQRIRQDSSATSAFPPTAAERSGDFSASRPAPVDPLTKLPFPGAQIPRNRFDPVAMKLLDRVPTPNNPATGGLSVLLATPSTGDNVLGRFDYSVGTSDRISVRYYFDYQRGVTAFPLGTNITGYSPAANSDEVKSVSATHLHTWSPNLISTLRGSFTQFTYDESNSVRQSLADLGVTNFPNAAGPARLPSITVSGRFVGRPGYDQQRHGSSHDYAMDWAWLNGKHEIKWGAQVQRNAYNRFNNIDSNGNFTFDGSGSSNALADFMLGRVFNFLQNSMNLQDAYYYIPAFYVQDNFKLSQRLTLNLGVRWEIYTPWRDSSGQMATYVGGAHSKTFPTAPAGMLYQTDPGYNYNTDARNFAPRIGFAWDVFGDGKTALRGGYAISYDGFQADQLINGDQPFTLNVDVRNPGPLSNPYANTPNPFPYTVDPAKAVYTYPVVIGAPLAGKNLSAMYNQNVSLAVERQLTKDWMARVGYVGNFGRKALNTWQFNPARYMPGKDASGKDLSTTSNTDQRRIYAPLYGGFRAFSSDANSFYNSLQAVLTKRLSRGFTLVAHYTLANGIDDVCTNEVASSCAQQDPGNRLGSRGPSDYDRRHVVVFSYLYELPFFRNRKGVLRQTFGGWQLAGINRIQTGGPFSVMTGTDASLTGVGFDRPNLVGNAVIPGDRSKADQIARWFDTSAFARNAPGQYGNAGRNILRGPGGFSWDISAQKKFNIIGEHQKLEFRADFFNIVNHASLNNPAASLNSPQSVGRISGSQGGRVLQMALRYEY